MKPLLTFLTGVGRRYLNPIVGLLMLADALALGCAVLLALVLRFDNVPLSTTYARYLQGFLPGLLMTLLCYLFIFSLFRLYRYAWRFASLEMVWGVIYANTIGLFVLIAIQIIILSPARLFPLAVYIVFWILSITSVGGARILLRFANLSRNFLGQKLLSPDSDLPPRRVVILGGGASGARLLTALHEEMRHPHKVIGFLDDQPHNHGLYIRSARVLGPLTHLYHLLDVRAVDEVFIALPPGTDIRALVMACRRQHVPVKVITRLSDVLTGKTRAHLEEISIEDLLRRPPINLDMGKVGKFLTGKRVLVTGAGGSIGSELCRQILAVNPAQLVLLGHGENSIHNIYTELSAAHPSVANRLQMAICSVTDSTRIEQLFTRFQPQVVFHAAAHKHVPIMEDNVLEAVQNNVLGTDCVAEICARHQVEVMLLISTDKAVNPSSVMGATKWLCEEALRAMAAIYQKTTFITVRFGNVLGSRGSVVPIFKEQIRRGGPVTVTHPEMTRYFMTIPEAVQLVLQASAIGHSGELFLLDMGEPVRILDLAHDMIRLSGLEPESDIPIAFTGLRPGEKLHEQLAMDDTPIETASCDRLFIVRRRHHFSPLEFRSSLQRLETLIARGDQRALLGVLLDVVPSFATYHQPPPPRVPVAR